jgi:hypothetical protein
MAIATSCSASQLIGTDPANFLEAHLWLQCIRSKIRPACNHSMSELWCLEPAETLSIISRRQSNLLSKKLSERTDILITTLRRDCVHGISGLGKQPLGPLNSRLSHEIEGGHISQFLKAPEESTKTHVCDGSNFSQVKGTIQVTEHKLPDGFNKLI